MQALVSDFPRVAPDLKPTLKRIDARIAFPLTSGTFYGTNLIERFYVRWSGALSVADAGRYTFFTESDDGSRVFIDDKLIVNNYGLHAMQEEEGTADLAAGTHRLKVEYIQYDGSCGINFLWQPPRQEKALVPEAALSHQRRDEAPDVPTAAANESVAAARAPLEIVPAPESAALAEKIAVILPRKHENMWMEIPWRRNLQAARMQSQVEGKPIFLWVMNGNPLGCT